MPAYINAFDNLDYGAYGRGAQCFDGYCSQDRVDIAAVPAVFPGSPHMTVEGSTRYVAVTLDDTCLVYAGPSPATLARAQVLPAGWWPMSVASGDVVSIRSL